MKKDMCGRTLRKGDIVKIFVPTYGFIEKVDGKLMVVLPFSHDYAKLDYSTTTIKKMGTLKKGFINYNNGYLDKVQMYIISYLKDKYGKNEKNKSTSGN